MLIMPSLKRQPNLAPNFNGLDLHTHRGENSEMQALGLPGKFTHMDALTYEC